MCRGKILVIEDQRHIARFLQFVLQKNEYEVFVVNNGIEGLAALREIQPHAVVLDLGLPDISGLEVLRRIRADQTLAKTKVMVLTATLCDESSSTLDQYSADAQCSKPIAPTTLIRTLENFNIQTY